MLFVVGKVRGDKVMEVIRVPFDYDTVAVSDATGLECKDVSLTIQADKDDADINTLVKRFGLSGELPTNVRIPLQSDFMEVMTFKDAQNALIEAELAFMEMPADVRERFNHDAGKFVEFASNPDNKDEARKLGLLIPEEVVPEVVPVAVRVVQEAPSGS